MYFGRMARTEIHLKKPDKSPGLGEQLESKVIIEGLLYLLAAFTANRELTDKFCSKCERLGPMLHGDNRCNCVCHRAREWVRSHGGPTPNLEHERVAV
jgi:hypothetical protein